MKSYSRINKEYIRKMKRRNSSVEKLFNEQNTLQSLVPTTTTTTSSNTASIPALRHSGIPPLRLFPPGHQHPSTVTIKESQYISIQFVSTIVVLIMMMLMMALMGKVAIRCCWQWRQPTTSINNEVGSIKMKNKLQKS